MPQNMSCNHNKEKPVSSTHCFDEPHKQHHQVEMQAALHSFQHHEIALLHDPNMLL